MLTKNFLIVAICISDHLQLHQATMPVDEERGKGSCMQRVSGCVCIYMDSHKLMKFFKVFNEVISEVAAELLTSVDNLL